MKRLPTMREIAKQAGFDRSTVSLALRGDRRLPAVTRGKIQAIARRMGYRRNPTVAHMMAQLRAGQQRHFQYTIGVLNFGPSAAVEKEVWKGVTNRARQLGYGLDMFDAGGLPAHRLEQILVSRGIRGVLVIALWGMTTFSDEFQSLWARFPSCCVGVQTNNPRLYFVNDDNYFSAKAAVENLARLGFTRIGLALEDAINRETNLRFGGGYATAHQADRRLKRLPILVHGKHDRDKFLSWFRRTRPEVVICVEEGIHGWLQKAGHPVPGDVSLVHLDLEIVKSSKWAGMHQRRALRGAIAIDTLVSQINRNEAGPPSAPTSILTESVWIPGETLRPRARWTLRL